MSVSESQSKMQEIDLIDNLETKKIELYNGLGFVEIIDMMPRKVPYNRTADIAVSRNARVSYAQGDKTIQEDNGLVRYLLENYHTSPSESVVFQFRIKCPIFVERQLIRHRTACISGDSNLHFIVPNTKKIYKISISEFYKKWTIPHKMKNKRETYIELIDPNKKYQITELAKITKRSTKSIISMIKQKILKATINENENENTMVEWINSILSMFKLTTINKNDYFKNKYVVIGSDYIEWANTNKSIPILKKLKSMKLQMCNEDTGFIETTTITDIWETGIKPIFEVELNNGYKIKTTKDHRYMTDNGWETLEQATGLKQTDDGNWVWNIDTSSKLSTDNYPEETNIMRLNTKIKRITYIGEDKTYDLSVDGPYHNFVCNGFIVHNSVNEQSFRYIVPQDKFYYPSLRMQSIDNKQGSKPDTEEIPNNIQETWSEIEQMTQNMYQKYTKLVEAGVAREVARVCLPVSLMTELMWQMDLHNLMHFLRLRMDNHAQLEIRVLAESIFKLIKPVVPISMQAFEDFRINTITFNADEQKYIQGTQIMNNRKKNIINNKLQKMNIKRLD
jgi:thymidylate synthase ThyX